MTDKIHLDPFGITSHQTRQKIFAQLDQIYQAALEEGRYACAIKVLELQGKELGLFTDKVKMQSLRDLTELSLEELQVLIKPTAELSMEAS